MKKMIRPIRAIALVLIFASILGLYGSTLYEMQVLASGSYVDNSLETIQTTRAVEAARGDILDRNGNLLVTSKTTYNVKISRSQILESGDTNDIVLNLVHTALDNGVSYNDTFPVTIAPTFEYVDMTDTQRSRLDEYIKYFELDPDITASELIVWMKDHYDIDYTIPLEDARLIIGVRYEVELRAIINIPDYTFADDVSVDFVSILMEKSLTGVRVETSYEREICTDYAAHILGNIGLMNAEEYETYKDKGYAMDAMIGKSGVEAAFEDYLHGTDGSERITTTTTGEVLNVETLDEAIAGENVYLTIDIDLQAAAEKALATRIAAINATRKEGEELATGGALVVMDVNTGDLLVSASYPTYDLSTFTENYTALSQDPTLPLFNRVTQGIYEPGSTFKLITAFAALTYGISPTFTVDCTGVYSKYPDVAPHCWVYPNGHGELDMVGAIENSCNIYFYTVSEKIGKSVEAAYLMADAAKEFGLGSETGIEIGEATGIISSPDYKSEVLNDEWYSGDTIFTAIGQGFSNFTPLQLATYTSAIANDGTRYKTTLLDRVMSSDYLSLIFQNTPVINGTVNDPNNYISILQEGMEKVASEGTASSMFGTYPVEIACKTGTVQSDMKEVDNGVFVCYAPADDPQIAISLVVENGGSGATIMSIAKDVLDAYFGEGTEYAFTAENTLIR